MSANMTGFGWFSKIFAFLCIGTNIASAIEGLTQPTTSDQAYKEAHAKRLSLKRV